ncbi:unnamed protein product, partial [Rotaria magnacalcarata]
MASKPADTKAKLRELMKQEKQKRIDSPLAKYTNTGQLYCALCNQNLTSETFWKAHVNGRDHKQKLVELKSTIKQTNADAVFAIPAIPPLVTNRQRGVKRSHDVAISNNHEIVGKPSGPFNSSTAASNSALPADFFDTGASQSQIIISKPIMKSSLPTAKDSVVVPEESPALPEG